MYFRVAIASLQYIRCKERTASQQAVMVKRAKVKQGSTQERSGMKADKENIIAYLRYVVVYPALKNIRGRSVLLLAEKYILTQTKFMKGAVHHDEY